MAGVRHLVLDAGVLLDLCLQRRGAASVRRLMEAATVSGHRLWIPAPELARLHALAVRALERGGRDAASARGEIRERMAGLLRAAQILSVHGFEQPALVERAAHLGQAQITAAARSLPGQTVCIVTRDRDFDTLGEVPCRTPAQALAWLGAGPDPAGTPLPMVDLATPQALARPRIERAVEQVLRHGRYVLGPEVAELERRLAAWVGVDHCITCASGTDALQIALMALGTGPGDEVIVPGFSFIACAETVAVLGARPVYVDVDARSCNLAPTLLEAAITPRTRAVIAVSLYGECADFDAIGAIAARHGLPVIEDAAQSFGATWRGRPSCGLGTVGCTSFFPSKPLGCYGDGGAMFTADATLAERLRRIARHGEDRRYHHVVTGLNSRLDSLQAALLLARLEGLPDELERRRTVAWRYDELLTRAGFDAIPRVAPHCTSVYAQYTVRVPARDQVQNGLAAAGIPTAVHYPLPLHRQPAVADPNAVLPVSDRLAAEVLSLPMHPWLEPASQRRIVDALLRACADAGH